MMPFRYRPPRNFNTIMMQMNCPDNIFFFVTHSFKTIRFHELPLAIVTEITLFYSNFPVPFTIFDNIFRLIKYAIHRSHLSITQKKTHSYINHSFSRQYHPTAIFLKKQALATSLLYGGDVATHGTN